jgi:asparagine synthase (glutamine-hydrolysing)
LNIDSDTIQDILTLRLNYDKKVQFFEKINNNLKESASENFDLQIKNSIIKYFGANIKNKKVSLALSSGIDSSLLLAILKEKFPDQKVEAISIEFKNSTSESKTASEIAQMLDVDHQTIYLENFLEELPKAISIVKQPFWDLHWYYLLKKAKTLSNCLISGDGADELFGGYIFRYNKFLSSITKNSSPIEKTQMYLECHQRDWVPDQENLFGKKINFSWGKIYKKIIPNFQNSLSDFQQIMLADYNGKLLHNFIPNNTKLKNYFNIKYLTPYLSKELISMSNNIPSELKYNQIQNEGKIILKKILKKYQINNLVKKEKQGFSVDTVNLWKQVGKRICSDFLKDARIVKEGWINQNWINKHQDSTDVRYVNKFLGIFALEIWFRIFITKEMNPNTKLQF